MCIVLVLAMLLTQLVLPGNADVHAAVEINLALNKPVTTNAENTTNLSRVTDGLKDDRNGYFLSSVADGPKYVQVDLGESASIVRLHLTNDWGSPGNERINHDVIVQLSNDAAFASGVHTVFNNDADNSSGLGAGTDAEYQESPAGKSIVLVSPIEARYVRVWGNGHTRVHTNEHHSVITPVELEVYVLSDDQTPPAAVTDLDAERVTWKSVELTWTAPGDDGNTGTAHSYDIRYHYDPITEGNWQFATPVSGVPFPQVAGTTQSVLVTDLTPGVTHYFAMKTTDEVENESDLSNVLTVTTPASDEIAPAAITDLEVKRPNPRSVSLEWTAPGNDGHIGTAESYDIRYSTTPITEANFNSAHQADITIVPAEPGTRQSFKVLELETDQLYYFAIKTADDGGNVSALSNVVSGETQTHEPDEVYVTSLEELINAIETAPFEGRIITLAAGTYEQNGTIVIKDKNNITIRGETDNFNDTVIKGKGINNTQVNHNINVINSDYVTLENMTLQDTYYHGVKIDFSQYFRASNLKTWDNGESGFKTTADTETGRYSDYGIIENSYVGFTTTGMRGAVEGIDGIASKGWVVRGNVIENVRKPSASSAAYGIFFKGNSIDTVIENNVMINNMIAISFGGGGTGAPYFRYGDISYEHRGGIVRNNVVIGGLDAGIAMNWAKDFKVYNNTVWSTVAYDRSIEVRYYVRPGFHDYQGEKASGDIRNNITTRDRKSVV